MRTEYLREFAALARRMNFTQTASELHMSQPTLSRHIAELEKTCGSQLITREEYPALTYAGEVLLDEVDALIACEDHLMAAMEAARGVEHRRLVIADWRYSHRSMELVRAALNRAGAGMPGFRAEFVPVPYGVEVVEALRQGFFDVGVLAHTALGEPVFSEPDDIAVLPLMRTRTRLHFFMDVDNPLADRPGVAVADLKGVPITVPLNPECVNIRNDITTMCARQGFSPTFKSIRLGSIDDMYCMDLRDSMLIGISEYYERGFANVERIRMVPCADEVYVTIYLLFRRDNPNPALRAFLDELQG